MIVVRGFLKKRKNLPSTIDSSQLKVKRLTISGSC